nr:SpaA isopeptide-forming pilin-related protein [uncultured Blautia sp.]
MKKRRLKAAVICLAICCMMLLGTVIARAEQKGSITLRLPQTAAGIEVTFYQIAGYENDGFVYKDSFAGSGINVSGLKTAAEYEKAATDLAAFAKIQKLTGTVMQAGTDGTISYKDVENGIYLAVQTGGEGIMTMQPVIIPVPYSEDSTEKYDPVLSPKTSFPGGAVILNKTDPDGKALEKAVFALWQKIYPEAGETVPEGAATGSDEGGTFYWKEFKTQLTTDGNGQIVVTDLPLGSYQFTEEKAPDGFIKLSEPVSFQITRAGQTAVVNGVYVQASGNVQVLSVVNQPEVLTPTPTPEITNTPAPEEPTDTPAPNTPSDNTPPSTGTTNVKTGDNTPILPMIIVLVLAVVVVVIVVIFKKKKHDK